ncbi:AAA family ATPase [Caenispirillum bisanense]|uniref:AAA family ATPase n=1 Tax=Caenispirillum bisanense TaxID=414052 RepID=UPI0031DFB625
MITRLAISGYRSLRDVTLRLGRITVVTGQNGSGKSSLYRSLRLLAEVADGGVIRSLAAEGGIASALWAGPEAFSRAMRARTEPVQATVRKKSVAMRLGFSSDDYGYAIDLGLPLPSQSFFSRDPAIKAEALWAGQRLTPRTALAERRGPAFRLRSRADGGWSETWGVIAPVDSMLVQGAGPGEGIELLMMRERLRRWRFYDDLRVDRNAPARRPQVGTFTPVLAADGADLAAALRTIVEIGDDGALKTAVADAFEGATVAVAPDFSIEMRQQGLLRPLGAGELSEGTLRYLLLVAALLSPQPPELMVLNEPESHLNPALHEALARLLAAAGKRCQLIVVTHAPALVDALGSDPDTVTIRLHKDLGETHADAEARDPDPWAWPSR